MAWAIDELEDAGLVKTEELPNILVPNAALDITVEINAKFPSGSSDQIKRSVTENATSLGFKTRSWE